MAVLRRFSALFAKQVNEKVFKEAIDTYNFDLIELLLDLLVGSESLDLRAAKLLSYNFFETALRAGA